MDLSPALGIIIGTALGSGYFAVVERSIPRESNCVYLAPWTTDLAAWIAGAVLVKKGLDFQDGLVCLLGSLIITIHVAQFAAHKTIANRGLPRHKNVVA